jgi:MFS family permease
MVPPMVLGPFCGAAADRWSRRRCAVVADAVRAVAFVGIALIGGFVPMLALALLAGTGTALFRPAILAGLPGLVDERRLPAATSLYGALDDFGHTLGPVLAAGLLLLAAPETAMLANGATFVISAVVLARIPLGDAPTSENEPRTSLLRETREGLRAAASTRCLRCLIAASSSILLFAGLFNGGELLLAKDTLGAGSSGYSVLVAVPDRLMGRVFGVKDALASWAFGAGFVGAGVLLPLIDTRALFVLAGAGVLVVWCVASLALRPVWNTGRAVPAPAV